MDRVYKLTKDGKRFAGSEMCTRRDTVLDDLYKCQGKTATDEELAVALGKSKYDVHATMRKYIDKKLVEEV